MHAIEEREVIEDEVVIPKGVKPIDTRFVYKWKDPISQPPDPITGEVKTSQVAKVRWTVKDFKSKPMTEFYETFAPTAKNVTFRIFLLISLSMRMCIHHIDVNTAFLYAPLEKPVYVKASPGRPCKESYCLKLVKALYGLRSAPRAWNTL